MNIGLTDGIFYVAVLIMSVVIHEVAHGYSAYLLGDDTAKLQGRLTLNPLKHLDPFGSVVLPLLLVLTNSGFIIGWAKPVPYNPRNLKKGRRDDFIVSISGIVANLTIALIFGLILRFLPLLGLPLDAESLFAFVQIASIIVITNLVLALFNLIPISPLDGSKVLFSILPARLRHIESFMEKWGLYMLIFFIVFVWEYVSPLIYFAFKLITGINLV
ncbi:MAG: site-2 protease family protein [Candidatus Moranbacteria bacterium]|nr:site-2 protease family protein [Candidatus Moranbacteria bacterium]